MDKPEFNEWLKDLYSLVPGKRSWLEKQPDRLGILEKWLGALSGVDKVDALTAAYQLNQSGELDKAWSDLPILVARRAESVAVNRQLQEARTSKGCEHCDNTGLVSCVETSWLRKLAGKPAGKRYVPRHEPQPMGVPCCCPRGIQFSKVTVRGQDIERSRYKPDQFCKASQDVIEWLENRKPKNYVDSFDAFNERIEV